MSLETPEPFSEMAAAHRKRSRPLRFHLMLWYGAFVAVSLGVFALLFLWLTTSSLYQSIDDTIATEARVAVYDIQSTVINHQIQPLSPADNLKLINQDVINNAVIFEIYNAGGKP